MVRFAFFFLILRHSLKAKKNRKKKRELNEQIEENEKSGKFASNVSNFSSYFPNKRTTLDSQYSQFKVFKKASIL